MTNHAGAAEVALVGQVNVTTGANRPAEAGGDFVIAQVDVRAATGTVRGRSLIADFVFSFAFEAGDDAIAPVAPNVLELAMKRNFSRNRRRFFRNFGCRFRCLR